MSTPEKAFKQGIFDIVVEKAASMPHQARGADGICALRDGKGNACFLGHIMSDEEVMPKGELINGAVATLLHKGVLPQRYYEHVDILTYLQGIHDYNENWSDDGEGPPRTDVMRIKFRQVAELFGLKTDRLDLFFPAEA